MVITAEILDASLPTGKSPDDDRCREGTACGSFERKGLSGLWMWMLDDARWKIIEHYCLWSTACLLIISERTVPQCTFFPAKWWVEICQCSFHHSQAIIFSPVESDVAPTFGDMNEMKRWCFSKALGFSSKNIAVNLSYAQQMSSTTDKIVHGDSCYSMVNSTTITTVIVNSYSYDTRTIC